MPRGWRCPEQRERVVEGAQKGLVGGEAVRGQPRSAASPANNLLWGGRGQSQRDHIGHRHVRVSSRVGGCRLCAAYGCRPRADPCAHGVSRRARYILASRVQGGNVTFCVRVSFEYRKPKRAAGRDRIHRPPQRHRAIADTLRFRIRASAPRRDRTAGARRAAPPRTFECLPSLHFIFVRVRCLVALLTAFSSTRSPLRRRTASTSLRARLTPS